MQGLPMIGLLAFRLEERRGKLLVYVSLLIWIALTFAAFLQAIAGKPLFPL